jgi:hypothetical protein
MDDKLNTFIGYCLTAAAIGLEILAAGIWQHAGLAKSIAHLIVITFIGG